jgi:hypothetical protein
MNEAATAIPTVLPPRGNATPEQTAKKSLTHWVCTLYKRINNMGPLEIKSQLGYHDQRWTEFKRCVPYPLSNLTSWEPDRSAIGDSHSQGFSMNSEMIPKIEYVKYAQAQAAELGDSYKDEGLRVLLPLIGMDDFERVNQIVQTVMPFEYRIFEMAEEFTSGAEKRINKSNLPEEDKGKARELAKILLNGSQDALTRGNAEYEALITSMSDAQVGKPGISNPNPFHHWICGQLNKEVPERVNRMAGGGNSAAIDILARRALKEESAAESMSAELAQEREARAALEAKVDQLLAAQGEKQLARKVG